MSIGPVLPPGWAPSPNSSDSESDSEPKKQKITEEILPEKPTSGSKTQEIAPILPTDLEENLSENALKVGPVLPPGFQWLAESNEPETSTKQAENSEQDCYGPVLPPDFVQESSNSDSESDDGAVGPSLPPENLEKDYEERLCRFKQQEMIKEMGKQKREQWMTELPTKLQNYGLGARTFSKRGVESSDTDHSAWTDSPAEKLRKTMEGESGSVKDKMPSKAMEKRDKELEQRARDMNKDRNESLVNLHKKKRNEGDEKDGGKIERRPFDREVDLTASKISASGTKKLVDTASKLGARFGHGKQQKYL